MKRTLYVGSTLVVTSGKVMAFPILALHTSKDELIGQNYRRAVEDWPGCTVSVTVGEVPEDFMRDLGTFFLTGE
jgi:hypothetical protein